MRKTFVYSLVVSLTLFGVIFSGCAEPGAHRAIAQTPAIQGSASFAATPPPLYWTTYEYCYTHDDFIPEDVWQKNVEWVADQLKPLGYTMIVTDGWIYGDAAVNADGYLTKYNNSWQGDWTTWSNSLAQKGLSLGIYYNPLWIQASAYAQNNRVHGTSYTIQQIAGIRRSTGKYEKYWIDPSKPGAKEYVQGYVAYFKAMNVKLLRLDFLSEFENDYGTANYDKVLGWIREAAGQDLFLSLVMPNEYHLAATEIKYGNMMRVSEDSFQGGWPALSDRYRGQLFPIWPSLRNAFDGFIHFSPIAGMGRMILDGDALRLNTFASDVERKTAVILYTMAGSPIPIADQVNTIGSSLPFYSNPELRQLTESWFVGKPLHAALGDFDNQRWMGRTQDGHWIVALFNRDDAPKTITFDFAQELETTGPIPVRDLWSHTDLPPRTSFSATLAPHDSMILKVGK
jgi:hypothetical protein